MNGIGKMCRTMVTVINHRRSYSGDPFKVLVSETSLFCDTVQRGRRNGSKRLAMAKILSRQRDAVLRT